jgi:Uma2 family endonuclease
MLIADSLHTRQLSATGGTMSRATTEPSLPASSPLAGSSTSVPSFEELRRWTSEPDQRVVIRGVNWAYYEQLLESIPEGANIHVDYDGKDVEVMCPSPLHDAEKKLMAQFVEAVAQELEVPYNSLGHTTWKRPEVARGLESDECYFFKADKLTAVARAKSRRSGDVADYPNPDLAIEVDLSRPKIDRTGIYAALQIPEVWRFEGQGEQVIIERLGADGAYQVNETSGFLPVRAEEVKRWVVDENSEDQSAWARRLRDWVRTELRSRLTGPVPPAQ